MNRGSALSPSEFRTRRVRFNEAPIHESGKFESDPQWREWRQTLQ